MRTREAARNRVAQLAWLFCVSGLAFATGRVEAETVNFDRDVRPLLSDRCFRCHGPDENQRQADLRLDTREFLQGDGILVAGDASHSELYRRLTADDPAERMPPVDAKASLTSQEIKTIEAWIDQGAEWQDHWAFVAPRRPKLPQTENGNDNQVRRALDTFVAARLQQIGLRPNGEADRTTLIRRVTMDLTGLPPSRDEVDAFLNDESPIAYEKVVDRLLASPRYGERMAVAWLDAARFADTSGYQNDGPRSMWRWRDWAIEAYNRGITFDQFTIEQLAGDLLPDPTLQQRIATGFNRNHRGNSEGGIIPAEYQVEYVVDRVETTSMVWMGLTLGCARCHDHKFDPVTQREFYQLYAFFNNIPEHGRAIKEGNSPPYILAPTAEQVDRVSRLESQLASAQLRFAQLEQRSGWTPESFMPNDQRPTIAANLRVRLSLDGNAQESVEEDERPEPAVAQGGVFRDGSPEFTEGRIQLAGQFDGRRYFDAGNVARFGYRDPFTLMAWIRAEPKGGMIISKTKDESQQSGYYMQLVDGHLHFSMVVRWLDDAIRVATAEPIPMGRWTHVAVAYDGRRVARGISVLVDGEPVPLRIDLDAINQTFAGNQPLRIGGGGGREARFHGQIDEVRVYDECLSHDDIAIAATPGVPFEIASKPRESQASRERAKLQRHFLIYHAPADLQAAYHHILQLQTNQEELLETLPTVMVMEEMSEARPTYVLARGQYDRPGEQVSAGVPRLFPPLDAKHESPTRLDLAHWLMSDSHPLTARVAVNRYWLQFFGEGLVKTNEDFGTQGDRPSHPQLLDWLAREFQEHRWDIKSFHRKLVTSATYRRSSTIEPGAMEQDPTNRWLARGPRYRLSAEMIRDQALVASGLLVEQVGGPSVKPYQPADLWSDIASNKNYEQDRGASLYRRSLYTYWKRTVSPPTMATFDASTRETCRVNVSRTNTPLQALTLMNDVTFVEAARVLAQRVIRSSATRPERLREAFRSVLARQPRVDELAVLAAGLEKHLDHYRGHPEEALQLASSGEYPLAEELDHAELAAYTTIASLILNLDEALTKQ